MCKMGTLAWVPSGMSTARALAGAKVRPETLRSRSTRPGGRPKYNTSLSPSPRAVSTTSLGRPKAARAEATRSRFGDRGPWWRVACPGRRRHSHRPPGTQRRGLRTPQSAPRSRTEASLPSSSLQSNAEESSKTSSSRSAGDKARAQSSSISCIAAGEAATPHVQSDRVAIQRSYHGCGARACPRRPRLSPPRNAPWDGSAPSRIAPHPARLWLAVAIRERTTGLPFP